MKIGFMTIDPKPETEVWKGNLKTKPGTYPVYIEDHTVCPNGLIKADYVSVTVPMKTPFGYDEPYTYTISIRTFASNIYYNEKFYGATFTLIPEFEVKHSKVYDFFNTDLVIGDNYKIVKKG